MTPNEHEQRAAMLLLWDAGHLVNCYSASADKSAASVALLVRALELATPDWPESLRASLFTGDDE